MREGLQPRLEALLVSLHLGSCRINLGMMCGKVIFAKCKAAERSARSGRKSDEF